MGPRRKPRSTAYKKCPTHGIRGPRDGAREGADHGPQGTEKRCLPPLPQGRQPRTQPTEKPRKKDGQEQETVGGTRDAAEFSSDCRERPLRRDVTFVRVETVARKWGTSVRPEVHEVRLRQRDHADRVRQGGDRGSQGQDCVDRAGDEEYGDIVDHHIQHDQ